MISVLANLAALMGSYNMTASCSILTAIRRLNPSHGLGPLSLELKRKSVPTKPELPA